jgi:hypothetical protein
MIKYIYQNKNKWILKKNKNKKLLLIKIHIKKINNIYKYN